MKGKYLVKFTFSTGASLKQNPSPTISFLPEFVNSSSTEVFSFYEKLNEGAMRPSGAVVKDLARPKSSFSRQSN